MDRSLLVVDDHENVAVAIAHLAATDGWHPVHVADGCQTALASAAQHRPDLVTVDLSLGDENGLDLIVELREQYPHLPIAVLTATGTAERAVDCLKAGANAFIPKSTQPDELMAALRAALDGHTWLPVGMIGPVLQTVLDPPPASEWEELVNNLSAREHTVLELMVAGLDRRDIAGTLTISLNTVRTHVKNILAKLGVHSSLEAVSLALRAGMRPPDLS